MTKITLGQLTVQWTGGEWLAKCPNCGVELMSPSGLGAARKLGWHAREVSQCAQAIYRKTGVTE